MDILLVGNRLAQAVHPGAIDVERAELAVAEQGNRVVNLYGQYGLCLYVQLFAVQAGIDVYRFEADSLVTAAGFYLDAHGGRQQFAQSQRRNGQAAFMPWLQAQKPAAIALAVVFNQRLVLAG